MRWPGSANRRGCRASPSTAAPTTISSIRTAASMPISTGKGSRIPTGNIRAGMTGGIGTGISPKRSSSIAPHCGYRDAEMSQDHQAAVIVPIMVTKTLLQLLDRVDIAPFISELLIQPPCWGIGRKYRDFRGITALGCEVRFDMLHEHCPDPLPAHRFIHILPGDPTGGKVNDIGLVLALLDDSDHKPEDRRAINGDGEFPATFADFVQVLIKDDGFIARGMPHAIRTQILTP
jgi:hypothetical protein